MSFAIVEWLDEIERTVSVVPTNWLFLNDGDVRSWWPSADVTKFTRNRTKPKDTWKNFPVRQLGKAGKITFTY